MDHGSTLKSLSAKLGAMPVGRKAFVGMDGFIDNIIAVVRTRRDAASYEPYATIPEWAKAVDAAGGKSANFELAIKATKLGGNGPIMANALCRAGLAVSYMGVLGDPIAPVFKPFADACKAVDSIGAPGVTDALEFSDGKLMLGKYESLAGVGYKTVMERVGLDRLTRLVEESDLIAMTNWTMMIGMTELWKGMLKNVLPRVKGLSAKWLFIDLADPAKRTRADLLEALGVLQKYAKLCRVILGLNLHEAEQVAAVLGVKGHGLEPLKLAQGIRKKIKAHSVVVHPVEQAACSSEAGDACVAGPYSPKPRLATGAGDNFNAGFCHGLLAGGTPEEALYCGVCTSGYYVRNMGSPQRDGLRRFAEFWAERPGLKGEAFDKAYFAAKIG